GQAHASIVGPQAATQVTSSAAFVTKDSATQGTWQTAYGADGYNISQFGATVAAYAGVTLSGNANYVWTSSTTDARALLEPGSPNRLAACWYSGSSFNIDVNLTDGKSHQLALYALDWDSYGPRSERIDVLDAGTGTVLNSQTVSSFAGGQYLVWNVSGHVQFRVTNLVAGANAVVSGLFFGTGTVPSITSQPTNQTVNAGQSATLNLTAIGMGPLTYQWQKLVSGTWTNLSGAKLPTLSISSAQAADAGQYRVV